MPPPTAVIVPSSSAGSQPSPMARVADNAAAEAGQDGQRAERDRVQPLAARDHPTEHRVGQHPGQVDRAERADQGGIRHRHGHRLSSSTNRTLRRVP